MVKCFNISSTPCFQNIIDLTMWSIYMCFPNYYNLADCGNFQTKRQDFSRQC